jgi:translation elongation factor EF-1beta
MHLTNLHLNIAGNDFQQQGSLNIENTIANIQNISSLDISNNSKYDLNVTSGSTEFKYIDP